MDRDDRGLLEIVVQAVAGERPEHIAQGWARRFDLQDGVRVSVVPHDAPARPRRFVVYQGQIVSPQRYAAVAIGAALVDVLRDEARSMDPWEILQAARRRGSPVGSVPVATITRAVRLLQREGRVRAGADRGTWTVRQPGEAAA